MGAELFFEGIDGAFISNETLNFLLDMIRQSGNIRIDKSIQEGAKMMVKVQWGLLVLAFLLNILLRDKKILTIKYILINHL